MRYFYRVIVLLLILIGEKGQLFSQTLSFRTFNADNGLEPNYIYQVTQSKQGFIWLATNDGVGRFDGHQFRFFNIQNGLAENFSTTVLAASDDKIWVGHYQAGISVGKPGQFTPLNVKELKNVKITAIVEDRTGKIWIGTFGKGVYCLSSEGKLIHSFLGDLSNISTITLAGSSLLIGTDYGLYFIEATSKLPKPKAIEGGTSLSIVAIAKGKSSFWILTDSGEIYETNNLEKPSLIHKARKVNSASKLTSICEGEGAALWIGTAGAGLIRSVENSSDQIIDTRHGLGNDFVQSIFSDIQGNIWIGSYGGGLFQYLDQGIKLFSIKEGSSSAVLAARKWENSFLVGGFDGLDLVLEGENTPYNTLLNNSIITAISPMLPNGKIWVGTEADGVFICEKTKDKKGRLDLKVASLNAKLNLPKRSVNCLVPDSMGNMYIGTTDGLYLVDAACKKFTWFNTDKGLAHNNIRHVFIDSKGRIWFAAHGTGLFFYDNKEFTIFKEIPGFRSYKINMVAESPDGLIWFGTIGDGIFSFDGKKFKNYTIHTGLLSNYVYGLIIDKDGIVYGSHRGGISVKEPKKQKFHVIGKSEGLIGFDASESCAFIDNQGETWFGCTKGILNLKYKPAKERELPLHLTEIKVDSSYYSEESAISLPYGKHSLKLSFVGLDYSEPNQVEYKYMLEGFDSHWQEVSGIPKQVVYPRLEDGTYRFIVYASSIGNSVVGKPAVFNLSIDRPYWKKWWFYLSIIIGTSTIGYTYITFRTRRLLNQKRYLEAVVAERTTQLISERDKLAHTKMIVEEQNRDLTDSINYAKRIQDAVLPFKPLTIDFKDNLFIFHRPREIVSGDFYWYARQDHRFIICVADSTGHGVPGAFMSLIGNTLLNKLIHDEGRYLPSEVLREMDKEVIAALNQGLTDQNLKDGMDMALLVIDYKQQSFIFSGACRPLYLVRNGEVIQFQGSLSAIAGNFDERDKEFFDIEEKVEPGDMIYLFSDGYADQFGGEDFRKFTTRRLKELLVNIAKMPIEQQFHEVENCHDSWRGEHHQTDDILLIGIRLNPKL